MKTPEWVSPALYGAAAGAVALAIVGFSWGGWVTGGTARQMSADATVLAVATSLTPYCLERSRNDPNAAATMAELETTTGFNRTSIVQKAGWATPLGEDRPNTALARACERALAAS